MAPIIVIGVELWNLFRLHGLLACPSAARCVVFNTCKLTPPVTRLQFLLEADGAK